MSDGPVIETFDDERILKRTMAAGYALIAVCFGGFVMWGLLASLDSAAVAPGVVIVDSHRKTVQHLEGGIVREILVREGDRVEAGQVLVRLDATQADAQLSQLRGQHLAAQARLARLGAEQADSRELAFPAELIAQARDPALRDVIDTQRQLFLARWATYDGQIDVQRNRVAQLTQEIAALRAQSTATAERLAIAEEQLVSVRDLVEKGFERRPRLLELQSNVAELRGRRGQLEANIGQARQSLAAAEIEMTNIRNARRGELIRELQDTQILAGDLGERLKTAEDIQIRKEVTAPQKGVVVDLKFHTPGGIVGAGAPILDIVPQDDEMTIEAKISPTDIDSVRAGLNAHVRLTAFKQRRVPTIEGVITQVSADKLTDPRSGEVYFSARVKLSKESLSGLGALTLSPGMPAEVMIVTGARRALDYFTSPITDSMRRAFREE